MLTCKYCSKNIENHNSAGAHARWCEKNPERKIYKNSLDKNCKVCGTIFVSKRRITCSEKCARTMSDETKKNLSDIRKQYLKNNPDKHPWKKKNKHTSIPCLNVKNFLNHRNIQYVEEFSPLPDRHFSIDIAFPHIKVGIEINGNQHYTANGKLKPYYKDRHDLIEQAGWKLIEVHYSQCFDDESIQKFLNFDIPFDNTGLIESYFEHRKNRQELSKNNSLPRGQTIKQKTTFKWEARKEEIFNYNIDFSKYGWVTKVSAVLNISPQKVNEWMKRYHPTFYEKNCFKRK